MFKKIRTLFKFLLIILAIQFFIYLYFRVKPNTNETIPKTTTTETFICRNGDNIPLSAVNDNYCDCTDGEDEPLTSACNYKKFDCKFKLNGLGDIFGVHFIYSNYVNDGICDCCDGSDEINMICPNTCDLLKSKYSAQILEQKKGRVIKELYRKQAMINRIVDEKIYGLNAVYYHLSMECIEQTIFAYAYKICPFRENLQIKLTKNNENEEERFLIGKDSFWISPNTMVMTNGESRNCPNQISSAHNIINFHDKQNIVLHGRSSFLTFVCGSTNKIISVSEKQRCLYNFTVQVPSAC